MRGGSSRDVLRHLRTLYRCGVVGDLSDERLLDRFVARRDETAEEAFAELVQRHGPMVLGVARRVLGDAHEAEDAFQATFLVLARKAASVVRREKVANWLYGVAVRTAKEARVRTARRRAREERVSRPIPFDSSEEGFPAELRAILDEELARLPERYRGAVVLCELEGLPRPDAARRLGIPEGTLSSRLARAKTQLRDRLTRRGVGLPAVALSAALLREARATTLPLSLVESTVEAATGIAASPTAAAVVSASVASLTEGVLKAMLLAKLKGIFLGLGTLAAVVSGAVVLAQPGPRQDTVPLPPPKGDVLVEVPQGVKHAPDQADRTAALERKLDRILDALDRLSRTAPSPVTDLAPSSGIETGPPTPANPSVVQPPPRADFGPGAAPIAPVREPEDPQEPRAAMADELPDLPQVGPGRTGLSGPISRRHLSRGSGSIADRLDDVERRMETLDQNIRTTYSHVTRLQSRLAELENRVGGTRGAPSVDPMPPSLSPDRNAPPAARL
jgi:RNA polymerase sigma factor (sigma-70 family)